MTGYDSVDDFNLALIEEAHVVTVVGSSFGIPECLRFSYAVDEETFAEGIRRIKAFIDEKRK
jgi:Aspartate/tyrosine/aromatic aminotransferase